MKKISIILLALSLFGIKARAQFISGKGNTDTITYIYTNSDDNFDAKRTIVYSDKRSVDSLATVLVTNPNKQYQLIYRKEGQMGRVITNKELNALNRNGFYRIMIAYNKPGIPDDTRPMYIITSK